MLRVVRFYVLTEATDAVMRVTAFTIRQIFDATHIRPYTSIDGTLYIQIGRASCRERVCQYV